jgi:hypothetical protein
VEWRGIVVGSVLSQSAPPTIGHSGLILEIKVIPIVDGTHKLQNKYYT